MKLDRTEYDFFNGLSEKEFYAIAKADFARYSHFLENESAKNRRERHKRFDIEREKDFKKKYKCARYCHKCKHKNCENFKYQVGD